MTKSAVAEAQTEQPLAEGEQAEVDHALEMHKDTYGPGNTRPTFIVFLILLFVALIDLVIYQDH